MAIGRSAGDVFVEGHYRNAASFGREFSRQVQGPAERAATEASHHFGRKFAAGLAIGGALIGAGLVKATRAAVRGIQATTDKASDLNETINKTNVIFGKNAAEIQKWSRGSARNMGLSRQEALASASAFGDMFLQLKIGAPRATTMSKGMVQLAADFASFHNADISDVLLAQQSAFRGEYDALQRFVPGINAARVEQEALRETHKKSAKELTLAEKAQATYNIMLKDGRRATGDFQRTSNQLANTRRIEKAQIEDLQAAIGKRFLPAQLALHRALSEKLLPALGVLVRTYGPAVERFATRWATTFADAIPTTRQFSLGLHALAAAYKEGDVTSVGFVGGMERIGVAARKVVEWFRELRPSLSGMNRSVSQVGPALTQAGGAGHLFANSLAVVAPVLDVVARNIHNILPWLPTLVAGFLAFRAVQTAIGPISALGEAIRNFATPALVVATWANARAQKALATALAERTVAEVAAGRADAGLVVSTTAAGNAAGAAAGKFALFGGSLASTLSRLGLFATAAAAGAYQGQQMSKSLDANVKQGGPLGGVLDRINQATSVHFVGLRHLFDAQSNANRATATAVAVSERHTAGVRTEKQAIDALKGALAGEETAELDLRQAKINVATAQARLTELVKGGRKGSLDYRQAQLDLRRAQIDLKEKTTNYKDAQRLANAATGGAMHASQQAQPKVRNLGESGRISAQKLHTLATNARDAREAINKLPNKRVEISGSTSLHFTKSFTQKDWLNARLAAGRMAEGGRITKGTGPTTDDVPIWVSKGETVVPADDSRDPGFRSWAAFKGIPGFRTGGIPLPSGVTKTGVAHTGVGKIMDRWGTLILAAGIKKAMASFGKPGVLNFIRSLDPLPYGWSHAGPGSYDCSGAVGAVHLAHLGRPHGHGQRLYTTGSIHAGIAGLKPGLGGVLEIGVTPARGHMAGRYGGPRGLGFEAESTRTGIKIGAAASRPESFARHFHLARGGRITEEMLERFAALGLDIGGDADKLRIDGKVLDRGGYLDPGVTVAHNRTGHPERVVPPGPMIVTLDPASARLVADHVVRGLHSTPIVVSLDGNQLRTGTRNAQRRAGIPAREQIR